MYAPEQCNVWIVPAALRPLRLKRQGCSWRAPSLWRRECTRLGRRLPILARLKARSDDDVKGNETRKGTRMSMEDAAKERLRDRECSVGLPTHLSLYDHNEVGNETDLTSGTPKKPDHTSL